MSGQCISISSAWEGVPQSVYCRAGAIRRPGRSSERKRDCQVPRKIVSLIGRTHQYLGHLLQGSGRKVLRRIQLASVRRFNSFSVFYVGFCAHNPLTSVVSENDSQVYSLADGSRERALG